LFDSASKQKKTLWATDLAGSVVRTSRGYSDNSRWPGHS